MLNGREGDTLLVNGIVNPRVKLKRGVPVRMRLSIMTFATVELTGTNISLRYALPYFRACRSWNDEFYSSSSVT